MKPLTAILVLGVAIATAAFLFAHQERVYYRGFDTSATYASPTKCEGRRHWNPGFSLRAYDGHPAIHPTPGMGQWETTYSCNPELHKPAWSVPVGIFLIVAGIAGAIGILTLGGSAARTTPPGGPRRAPSTRSPATGASSRPPEPGQAAAPAASSTNATATVAAPAESARDRDADSARRIVRERYARGEIMPDEFRRLLDDLA
jgi:hypothetical protein